MEAPHCLRAAAQMDPLLLRHCPAQLQWAATACLPLQRSSPPHRVEHRVRPAHSKQQEQQLQRGSLRRGHLSGQRITAHVRERQTQLAHWEMRADLREHHIHVDSLIRIYSHLYSVHYTSTVFYTQAQT